MIVVIAIASVLVGYWFGWKGRKAWESNAEWSAETEGFVRFRADLVKKADRMSEEDRRTFLGVVDTQFCSLGDDLRGSGPCCAPGFEVWEGGEGSPTPEPAECECRGSGEVRRHIGGNDTYTVEPCPKCGSEEGR